MTIRLLFTLLLAAAVSACSHTARAPATPDWVHGSAGAYPDSQYLIGRGQGGRIDEASDRARAELAKGFEVAIHEQRSDLQRVSRDGQGSSGELTITRSLASETDQVLRGVRIAEVWRDPDSGQQHALAVLARAPAAQALRTELARLDERTRAQLAAAREANEPFGQIRAARGALETQQERAAPARALRVVDPHGPMPQPPVTLARLEGDLNGLLARVRIAPEAESETVRRAAAGGLRTAGFAVGQPGSADYTLRAALSLDEPAPQQGWHWVRGTLEITLVDSQGTVTGTRRWPIKEAGTDSGTAQRRALDAASVILGEQLGDAVLDFAGR